METIRIMVACNEAYAMPMTIAAHSALSHIDPDRPVEIHIIEDGVTPESRARSQRSLQRAHPLVTVVWRKADLTDMSGVNYRHYSAASLIRILMPRLFDETVQKVLYIDSDVVVTGNVGTLFDMDLTGKAIWAVQDGADEEFENRIGKKFPWMNAPVDARYFNSGVLMVNLVEWRRSEFTERVLDFLQKHDEELSFPDQDALNAIALGDWGRLPSSWNQQPIFFNWKTSWRLNEPGLIHYTCCKPWDSDYTWSGKRQYHKAYLASGWDNGPTAWSKVLRLYSRQVFLQSKERAIRLTRRALGLRPVSPA
jgi:lipopolysaccharide biosynthesis glycosyltransferase